MTTIEERDHSLVVAGARIPYGLLLLPALVTLALGVALGSGYMGSDDLEYAQLAQSLLSGSGEAPLFRGANHHDSRFGMTLPLAAIFSVLEPSPFALSLLPLACTAFTALLVTWLAWRVWGRAVGVTAGLVFASLPIVITLSNAYLPESIASFELCAAAALVLIVAEDDPPQAGTRLFAAGMLVGIAYLTTEVAALMIPVFGAFFVIRRGLRLSVAWLFAGFAVILGPEMTYHAVAHGAPLYRFMGSGEYAADPMVIAANVNLKYRLLKSYPNAFLYPGYELGTMGPLLILAGLYGVAQWRQGLLFLMWPAVILLFYNFMSASLTHYVALPVAVRLLMPAFAPLAILAAKLLVDAWSFIRHRATPRIRITLRTVVVVIGAYAIVVSLVCMYLATRSNLTTAIAQNAVRAAEYLNRYPVATVITDITTAQTIDLMRSHRTTRTYVRFADAGRFANSDASNDSTNLAFAVLNGGVINEAQISGHTYGGTLSLTPDDRVVVDHLQAGAGTVVLAVHEASHPVRNRLLNYDMTRRWLGSYGYGIARMLISENPPFAELRIIRLGKATRAASGATPTPTASTAPSSPNTR